MLLHCRRAARSKHHQESQVDRTNHKSTTWFPTETRASKKQCTKLLTNQWINMLIVYFMCFYKPHQHIYWSICTTYPCNSAAWQLQNHCDWKIEIPYLSLAYQLSPLIGNATIFLCWQYGMVHMLLHLKNSWDVIVVGRDIRPDGVLLGGWQGRAQGQPPLQL